MSVMGIWTGEEQKKFQAVHRRVQRAAARRHREGQPGRRQPADRLRQPCRGGNPPDIADIAQPGLIQGFVDQGGQAARLHGADRPGELRRPDRRGRDCSTTSSTASCSSAANKSLYWYNVQAFSDAGVEATDDWNTFLENAETLKASGIPAYSIAGANG